MRALLVLLALLAAALPPRPARAGDFTTDAIGTAGAEFLNVDAGARGTAMGGAFSAVVNDATSMYWNPAGLTQIPRASASFMHNRYLADISFHYLGYGQRVTETGVLAGALRFMDAGKIAKTDINGNTQGDFHPRSYVYEVGWGQYITDLTDLERDVSIGVSGRFIHSEILEHASGFAGDAGMQMHFYNARFPYHFSFVLQNLGRGLKFAEQRDTLPFRGRLGASINLGKALLLSTDFIAPIANQPYGAVGGELTLAGTGPARLSLRGGVESRSFTNGLEGFRSATFGMGLSLASITFDYAFVPYGTLGDTHRFAVSFNLPAKASRRYRER